MFNSKTFSRDKYCSFGDKISKKRREYINNNYYSFNSSARLI